jgi:hypothetical protein
MEDVVTTKGAISAAGLRVLHLWEAIHDRIGGDGGEGNEGQNEGRVHEHRVGETRERMGHDTRERTSERTSERERDTRQDTRHEPRHEPRHKRQENPYNRTQWISRLERFHHPETHSLLSRISVLLLQLQDEDAWTQEQFRHVKQFPLMECECGTSLCFSCGAVPFHVGKTCMQHMREVSCYAEEEGHGVGQNERVRGQEEGHKEGHNSVQVHSDQSSDRNTTRYPREESLTIKWKLENTKQCPQCSTMITRSEGCNKVECLVCGHVFCWNCLGDFRVCGYYKCALGPVLKVEHKQEMGVPNVDVVYRRFGFAN